MPTVIREPEVNITLVSADTLVGNKPQRILVIGQMITLAQSPSTGGNATPGQLYTNLQNDQSIWSGLFGTWSQLSGMIKNVRRYNGVTRVDAIPLEDNGSGVAASGEFNITGTATENGSFIFILGSKQDYSLEIPVLEGETASQIATKLETAIINDPACADCPFSVGTPVGGDVPLTAGNAGTVGNTFGLKVENEVAGMSVSVTGMSGGVLDPSFVDLFDVIEDERYQTVIWPYTDDIDTIKDELDSRFNVNNNILDGVAVMAIADTFANQLATLNANNSQSLAIFAQELVNDADNVGPDILEIPYATAAQIGGLRGLRLTDGANIGQFVQARVGGLDRFGGIAIASLPYFNTPVPQLPLMDIEDGWSAAEIEFIKAAGGGVIGNNIPNNEVLLGEVPTTYKTDTAGNEDVTFKYLNYVDTSSNIREYFFNNLKARFAQSRLTEGSVHAGRTEANGEVIEAFCARLYQALANEVLVQDGETAIQFYKENLLVTLDLAEGKATVQMKVPIVVQLRKIVVTIQVAFTAEG